MNKYGKLKRGLLKFSDLVQDPRTPLRVLEQILNSPPNPKVELEPDLEVKVSLTVDVEHDFGIQSTLGETSTVEEGVSNLLNFYEDNDISGTFFVSNLVVENFPDLVKETSREHEVGVHGYNHECWSDPKWWIPETRILTREEKVEKAGKMRESVAEITSTVPKSFRAPYMAADEETLRVLDDLGFKYDSSAPSYYGEFPEYYHPDDLSILEVPISAEPQSQIEIFPIPHAVFKWLNTKLLTNLGAEETVNLVEKILKYQKIKEVEPHVVMLLHQWEFVEPSDVPGERFEYSSPENMVILERFFDELKDRFELEFLSIENLDLE